MTKRTYICASAAYATVTLSSGAEAASFGESMAQQADDHEGVCCQIRDKAVAADLTYTTMFETTPLLSFSGLVENVPSESILLSSDPMVSKCVAACRF